jgi:hypothetical protein
MNISKFRYNIESTNNSSQPIKYYLNESDVVIGRVYNEFYVMIIRQMSGTNEWNNELNKTRKPSVSNNGQTGATSSRNLYGYSEIAMYKLLTDSPAKKTNILKINLAGRFTLNIIDELIIVHHRTSYSSMVFDIKISSTGKF